MLTASILGARQFLRRHLLYVCQKHIISICWDSKHVVSKALKKYHFMNSSRGMHDVGTHPEHLQFGLIYRSVRLLEMVYIPSNSSCYIYVVCHVTRLLSWWDANLSNVLCRLVYAITNIITSRMSNVWNSCHYGQ